MIHSQAGFNLIHKKMREKRRGSFFPHLKQKKQIK